MEIYKNNEHWFLRTEAPVQVYVQNKMTASGFGCLDLGSYAHPQPLFEIHQANRIYHQASRCIPDCDIVNIRDLGGYQTEDGRRVKYHRLYRGAALTAKTAKTKQQIDQLGIQVILDLRSRREIARQGEDYLSAHACYHHCSGLRMLDDPETEASFDFDYLVQSGHIHALIHYMKEMYCSMPIHNKAFQAAFEHLKQEQTPLYFHCSAGKDRTGVLAALILLCLGVDEKTVTEDYLLSNTCRKAVNERMISRVDKIYQKEIRPLYEVDEKYLKSALDTIRQTYGSYETFFEKEYQIDAKMRQRLKDLYCE